MASADGRLLSLSHTAMGSQNYDSQAFIQSQVEILRRIEAENSKMPPAKTKLMSPDNDKMFSTSRREDSRPNLEDDALNFYLSDPELLREQRALYAKVQSDTLNDVRVIEAEKSKKPPFKTKLRSDNDQTLTFSTARCEDSLPNLEDDAFNLYLSDPDLLREQRALYAQVQSDALSSVAKSMAEPSNEVHELLSLVEQTSLYGSQRISDRSSTRSRASRRIQDTKARPTSDGKDTTEMRDHTTTLANGKKLRIKGTKHVYNSIARGTAVLVQCACCQMVSQVEAGTKALYCISCQSISPVDQNQISNLPSHFDGAVAKVVQQQEVDVACARKMAKVRAPSQRSKR